MSVKRPGSNGFDNFDDYARLSALLSQRESAGYFSPSWLGSRFWDADRHRMGKLLNHEFLAEVVIVASEGHPQSGGRELIDLNEAAIYYGCQVKSIQDFIARGILHPLFDKQEIEDLRQKHLQKQISSRSNPRQKRR